MDDLIKSMGKSLLAFDKVNFERDLTRREKKEKEHLKYEIYWAKFKKFKADFSKTAQKVALMTNYEHG
ncbi:MULTISPECIES: hypothetical protein [unclassified Sphingobacterium]|uniref:hypothetical protein n=1 Tax=unclassified Sphingobacterium TaxID=2609468 RepID=UPI001045ECFD|nr:MULTISPECIES: hypothetical protein [unclassified Sphingobacterium]MCS3556194.1 hypothetical protein [Sphingobacterium sp. JUb21]TCR08569.1 hypothetical protein EDF66_103116 [Sphingobacterium sp. JUb20]